MSMASDISTISSSLNAIKNAIIDKGVTPSGNITTYADAISQISGGGSSTKYGALVYTLLGDVNVNGVLQLPTEQSNLVFTDVTDVVDNGLYYKFARTGVKSVSFPDLTSVSKASSFAGAFYGCSKLESASFPNLITITGTSGCSGMFSYTTAMTSVSLPELTTATGVSCMSSMFAYSGIANVSIPKLMALGSSCCLSMFGGAENITNIYFNALTTTSFGSSVNQFANMFSTGSGSTSGTITMHFPSNLSSTIAGLTGYPNFGATTGILTLAFDLPATS